MFIYIFIVAFTLTFAYLSIASRKLNIGIIKISYVLFASLLLVTISTLRGDFTSDYKNYETLYKFWSDHGFHEFYTLYGSQEILFRYLAIFVHNVFGDYVAFIFIISLLVISLIIGTLNKYSKNIYLSIYLLIITGFYFDSFNLMRQILAASIVFAGYKFLIERKFIQYSSFVLIAFHVHQSAILMLPFYFILNKSFKFNVILSCVFLVALYIESNKLLSVASVFYSHYLGDNIVQAATWVNAVMPTSIFAYAIFHIFRHQEFWRNSRIEIDALRICLNSTLFFAFFSIGGVISTYMMQRISFYFAPFVLLFIPALLQHDKSLFGRLILLIVFVFGSFFIVYTLSGTGYNPYYTFFK